MYESPWGRRFLGYDRKPDETIISRQNPPQHPPRSFFPRSLHACRFNPEIDKIVREIENSLKTRKAKKKTIVDVRQSLTGAQSTIVLMQLPAKCIIRQLLQHRD